MPLLGLFPPFPGAVKVDEAVRAAGLDITETEHAAPCSSTLNPKPIFTVTWPVKVEEAVRAAGLDITETKHAAPNVLQP